MLASAVDLTNGSCEHEKAKGDLGGKKKAHTWLLGVNCAELHIKNHRKGSKNERVSECVSE